MTIFCLCCFFFFIT